jgi:hypothetical protein
MPVQEEIINIYLQRFNLFYLLVIDTILYTAYFCIWLRNWGNSALCSKSGSNEEEKKYFCRHETNAIK